MEQLQQWLAANYVELLGAILGLAYIIFSIRQHILTWATGLATSVLYVYVFFVSKFYADMGLQVYYVFVSIYGWYHWVKGNPKAKGQVLPVSRLSFGLGVVLSLVSVILYAIIAYILMTFTDSPVPFGDALTTALSIVATWMLARKILEHWLIWIFVDAVSMGLYVYKSLWPTVALFLVYTVMAYIGYIKWKKEIPQA